MTRKTLILAVETSSRIGSVAIALGEEILAETTFSAPMKHSAEIFPAIQHLLDQFSYKPCQIEHIYLSIGPGSFTGLRIAVSMAKAMHLANAIKIVTVDTLDVIAANVIRINKAGPGKNPTGSQDKNCQKVAPILDAKREQFFIAVYNSQPHANIEPAKPHAANERKYDKTTPDCMITAKEFLTKFACEENPIWLLGDGLLYHKDKFTSKGVRFFDEQYWSPRASKVHSLGWEKAKASDFADPVTLTPFYLRAPQVTQKTI